MRDDLGDRMKAYERQETGRLFLPMLPVYARIDGKGFSRLTKGMDKPFDARMSAAMVETTKYLVDKTHAVIGYTQSDEISLTWLAKDYTDSIFFDGKITKMTSVLAAMATAAFTRAIRGWEPFEDRYPTFDARVLQLPKPYEVANMFFWRVLDAERNAVSMACRHHHSAKEMHQKNVPTMIDMLAQKDVDFEAYPDAFRRGTWVRKEAVKRRLSADERLRIPASKQPPEDAIITRNEMKTFHTGRDDNWLVRTPGFIFGDLV